MTGACRAGNGTGAGPAGSGRWAAGLGGSLGRSSAPGGPLCVGASRFRPFGDADVLRRTVPFNLAALAGAGSLLLPPHPTAGPALLAGTAIFVTVFACVLLLPWRRMPGWAQVVPPLGLYLVFALFRHADGGATSGLAPLAALPVVWLALYGTRRQLAAAVACCAAAYAAPLILIGPPSYALSDWRRAALWTVVSAVIGPAIQGLVRSRERHTAGLAAVLRMDHDLDDVDPARARAAACTAAREVTGAGLALLMEPDGRGNLVVSAGSGIDVPPVVVPLSDGASATVVAHASGRRFFVSDVAASPAASREAALLPGVVSALFQPVARDGRPVAVLALGFDTPHDRIEASELAVIELVAHQVAGLLARADLTVRLEALAADATDLVARHDATPELTLRYVSPSARQLLGLDPASLLGTPLHALVHPQDTGALAALARPGAAQPTTVTFRARHASAGWVWLETTARPIADPVTGRVTALQSTSRDVTDRVAAQTELRATRDRFAAVLAAATRYSIIATDPDGLIKVFNTGAEHLLGYRADAMVDRRRLDAVHDPGELAERARAQGVAEPLEAIVGAARAGGSQTAEWTYLAADASRIPVTLTVAAMRDADGALAGFIAIGHDVSEQNDAMNRLRDAYHREQAMVAQLTALSRARDDFVASVTHDLRTPLTSIRGYAEILMETAEQLPAAQRRMIAVVDRNAARLLDLVDDLLTESRIDAGGLRLAIAPLDLSALLADLIEATRPDAARRHLSLTTNLAADLGSIPADRHHLERVLANLLSNAIKFTPDRGVVSVAAHRAAGTVTVVIADTGIGIPEREQSQLFTRFARATNATSQQIPGTGLGLSIARSILEQHGGGITLVSREGEGTTVTVTLPTAPRTRVTGPGPKPASAIPRP